MRAIASMAKLFMPGSIALLLLGTIAGGVLLIPERTRTYGRRLMIALAMLYWLLSTPVVADGLVAVVGGGFAPFEGSARSASNTIVVLDGGTVRYRMSDLAVDAISEPSALRALEAARVYRKLEQPLVIITAGDYGSPSAGRPEGQMLLEAVVRCGVPERQILLDTSSRNTREHALNVGAILRRRGVLRFVLVTSPAHMRRSVLAFRKVGLDPVAAPAPLRSDTQSESVFTRWRSSTRTLTISEQAIYDGIGLVYYWMRGWV